MKKTQGQGFVWVDNRVTHSEVSRQTQKRFENLRDEQLKALMLQVEVISKAQGVPLEPAFKKALMDRETLMTEHRERKAASSPD